jgi:alanyl-tRNA synthetase
VASGVRRIEALTGAAAFGQLKERERALQRVAELLHTPMAGVERRVQQVLDERRTLEKRLNEAIRGGGGGGGELQTLLAAAQPIGANGARLVVGTVSASDAKSLQAMGDALREQLQSGVGLLAARLDGGKGTLLAVVTDDLRARGMNAGTIVRDVAAVVGGRGGGKPHMAQAGIPDAGRLDEALGEVPRVVAAMVSAL